MAKAKLCIVHPHPVFHTGVRACLPDVSTGQIVTHTEIGSWLRSKHKSAATILYTGFLAVGTRHPGNTRREVEQRIKDADSYIICIDHRSRETLLARAAVLGAYDALNGSDSCKTCADVIKRAINGQDRRAKSPVQAMLDALHMQRGPLKTDTGHDLTNREHQVAFHVGFGLKNADIALSLGISIETVKEHVQNVMRKTNYADRTQVAVWMVRNGHVKLAA